MEDTKYNPEACKLRHESDGMRIAKLEDTLPRIFKKLEEMGQRPTWIVVSIITFLATGLGIMVTVLLKGGRG